MPYQQTHIAVSDLDPADMNDHAEQFARNTRLFSIGIVVALIMAVATAAALSFI